MKSFKQVFAVAGFTFRDAIRRRSFWITNIIYIVVILGACIILPRIGGDSGAAGNNGTADSSAACLLINESSTLPAAEQALKSICGTVENRTPAQRAESLQYIKTSEKNSALVEISADTPPVITITAKDSMSTFPSQAVWDVLSTQYRAYQFGQMGYNEADAAAVLQSALALKTEYADSQGISNYVVSFALMMVMFMTIYSYGYGVAMSVATEKSTRVMETLIVSAKPARILVGKCMGMGLVGLIQMAGVLILGGVSASVSMPDGTFAGGIGLPDLTPLKALLLVLYFLMGYALFSLINSMCGAMVSKMEDLQSAMMPATMVNLFSFYGGYLTVGLSPAMNSGSGTLHAMLLIPFTAAYAAPSALLNGTASPALIAASIAILLVTIVLVSFVAGKVYSASVLHYGSRLRFSDVRRMLRK